MARADVVEDLWNVLDFVEGDRKPAYLKRLHGTADGDGSLLDHSLILFGGGLGNGNLHDHRNLPCLLAGAGGQLNGGRHLAFPEKTPMTNLLLTMMDKVGVPTPEK